MACCFCGSDSHDRENCPWNGSGKRVALIFAMVLAVGCHPQNEQAVEPRYTDTAHSQYQKAVMVECSRAVAMATDAARAQGAEITARMMQRAFEQCLITQGVTI